MTLSLKYQFGINVKEMRKSLDISQENLAFMSGINRSHMGEIERGEKGAGLVTIERIAKALNCRPSELLNQIKSDLGGIDDK